MAIYNTESDAANTAVRAFLTKVGEFYLEQSFNTGSGSGKSIWEQIKVESFGGACAYCEAKNVPLQIEHVIMFNRREYGLHHPGNIIPSCKECNKRLKDSNGNYLNWESHLEHTCRQKGELDKFDYRKERILNHMTQSSVRYPSLNETEQSAIRVIAESLYENVKLEVRKALSLYKELDKAFVKDTKPPVDLYE